MNLSVLYFFMFLSATLTTAYQRRSIMMMLLGLEGITLMAIFIFLGVASSPSYMDSYLFVVILSFGVIEASLGLSLLVVMARKAGSDLVMSLTLSKC